MECADRSSEEDWPSRPRQGASVMHFEPGPSAIIVGREFSRARRSARTRAAGVVVGVRHHRPALEVSHLEGRVDRHLVDQRHRFQPDAVPDSHIGGRVKKKVDPSLPASTRASIGLRSAPQSSDRPRGRSGPCVLHLRVEALEDLEDPVVTQSLPCGRGNGTDRIPDRV